MPYLGKQITALHGTFGQWKRQGIVTYFIQIILHVLPAALPTNPIVQRGTLRQAVSL
jgi:hypothetical protein